MADLKLSLSRRVDKEITVNNSEFFISIYSHRLRLFLFFSVDLK